ncbi:MAG: hypothetical protein IPP72_11370 [Chitinophagaceae bacterium]|nr:hypothetical protein [Chitinophagaceae bacterium]
MKNLLSISFIIIYLFGNTEFGQVLNINQLINHYHQHHAASHNVTFIKFITMHYCSDDGTTADDEQDRKLPFKQIHQFSFIFFTTPEEQKLIVAKSYPVKKGKIIHSTLQDIDPVYLSTPIQPPRFTA